jgi:ABC-type glutathione transport system ATPase component
VFRSFITRLYNLHEHSGNQLQTLDRLLRAVCSKSSLAGDYGPGFSGGRRHRVGTELA